MSDRSSEWTINPDFDAGPLADAIVQPLAELLELLVAHGSERALRQFAEALGEAAEQLRAKRAAG